MNKLSCIHCDFRIPNLNFTILATLALLVLATLLLPAVPTSADNALRHGQSSDNVTRHHGPVDQPALTDNVTRHYGPVHHAAWSDTVNHHRGPVHSIKVHKWGGRR